MKFGLFILSVLSVKTALACSAELDELGLALIARELDGQPWSQETLEVLENAIERIDRALPELELLENRDKWEDALKKYGQLWKDTI